LLMIPDILKGTVKTNSTASQLILPCDYLFAALMII